MNRAHQPSRDMPEGNSSAELTAEHEFAKRELTETLQELRQRTNVPERSKQAMHHYLDRGHRGTHSASTRSLPATSGAIGVACAVAVVVIAISYLRNHNR